MNGKRAWRHWLLGLGLLSASCAISPDLTVDPTKHPVITAVQVPSNHVTPGGTLDLGVSAMSPDDSRLRYQWTASGGTISDPNAAFPLWIAPQGPGFGAAGPVTISVRVYDDKGRQDSRQFQVAILSN